MKPLVYIASPCRAASHALRDDYRSYAVAATRCALSEGVIPVTPHILYTQFLDDAIPEDRAAGLNAGRELLAHCDELWVFANYGISEGMKDEIALARAIGKRILIRGIRWG